MSEIKREFKVFIASPSGLENERKAFTQVIDEYNKEADLWGINFKPVGWESSLPRMGRPQAIINEELKKCDFFIILLHDRWGSDPGVNDNKATSGTEEEYLIAVECFKSDKFPMRQIVCLFKSVPENQMADPGPQLLKVLEFRKRLEDEKQLLYSIFSTTREFRSIIRTNLASWMKEAYIDLERKPIESSHHVNSKSDTRPDLLYKIEIVVDNRSKKILERAWELFNSGKLTEAEIEFSRAVISNPSESQLLNYSEFLF